MTERAARDRYLEIVEWARKRYTASDRTLAVRIGGMPTRFSRIEDMAAREYLEDAERHPGLSLRDCPSVK